LQVLRGQVNLGGTPLVAGEGAALTDEPALLVQSAGASEVLLFDLA
jgi:quercetin 2,3-dioxygenase